MVLTPSTMLELGTPAPDFTLHDTVSGKPLSLQELSSDKGTVIMFICNHCPYVVNLREHLSKFAKKYQAQGIAFIAISANDVAQYPDDSPEKMTQIAKEFGFPFPYLYDETQNIAKAYQAACTPDIYVFDAALKCVYRGQYDDSTPGNDVPVTGESLGAALDALIAGDKIPADQKPSIGCNIKWKD